MLHRKPVLRPSRKGIFLPPKTSAMCILKQHREKLQKENHHTLFKTHLQFSQSPHSNFVSSPTSTTAIGFTPTTIPSSSNPPHTHSNPDSTRSSPRTRSSSTRWPDRQSGSPCPSSALVEEPVGIGPGAGTSFAEEEGHSLAVEEGSFAGSTGAGCRSILGWT